jgi:toxin ParE1/3/4
MGKLSVAYHPAARLEALDAFDWYRDRSPSAAERFQGELERAQIAVQDSPEKWGAYLAGTRRYLLKPYPYIVVYRQKADRIEIVAIAHSHRKPGYWVDRLQP